MPKDLSAVGFWPLISSVFLCVLCGYKVLVFALLSVLCSTHLKFRRFSRKFSSFFIRLQKSSVFLRVLWFFSVFSVVSF